MQRVWAVKVAFVARDGRSRNQLKLNVLRWSRQLSLLFEDHKITVTTINVVRVKN